MEGFWIGWPEDDDVAAAYEVHIAPAGIETYLHVADGLDQADLITQIGVALGNVQAGRTPSGESPRRDRNLQEHIACLHAEVTSTGAVTVGWGSGISEDQIGGRAEARVLLRYALTDLERRGGSPLARDPLAG